MKGLRQQQIIDDRDGGYVAQHINHCGYGIIEHQIPEQAHNVYHRIDERSNLHKPVCVPRHRYYRVYVNILSLCHCPSSKTALYEH